MASRSHAGHLGARLASVGWRMASHTLGSTSAATTTVQTIRPTSYSHASNVADVTTRLQLPGQAAFLWEVVHARPDPIMNMNNPYTAVLNHHRQASKHPPTAC